MKSRKSEIRVLTSDNEDDGSGLSEDHSNINQDLRGVTSSFSPKGTAALNLNGNARATRGSATDPQSIYARVGPYTACTLTQFIEKVVD